MYFKLISVKYCCHSNYLYESVSCTIWEYWNVLDCKKLLNKFINYCMAIMCRENSVLIPHDIGGSHLCHFHSYPKIVQTYGWKWVVDSCKQNLNPVTDIHHVVNGNVRAGVSFCEEICCPMCLVSSLNWLNEYLLIEHLLKSSIQICMEIILHC